MMKILNKAIMILSVGLIAAQGIFSQIPGYIYGPDIDNWTPAIKDQQRENGKEFLRLLKEAKDKGLREINLKRGDYRFSTSFSEDPSKGMIVLKGYKNLMINGNGSQFWFDDSNTAISLESCENVNIRNLLIDYDPLPMTQGIVSAIGEDYLEFRIEEGFKSPVEIRKNINSPGSKSFIYDKDTRIIKRDIPHIVGRDFQDIGNNKVRASYTAYGGEKMNLLPIQAGDYIVIVVASKVAVSVVQSGNITLNNLSLYSSPNFGIYNSYCSGVRIENCNIIPRPGTKP